MTRPIAGLAVVAVAATAGCGGGGSQQKRAADKPCTTTAGHAIRHKPALPAGFPSPKQVVYTAFAKQGPSTTVGGYFRGKIDEAFAAYKSAFQAPFVAQHTEHKAVDAKIEFKGSGQAGQVKLLQTCKGRTTVTLTFRPA